MPYNIYKSDGTAVSVPDNNVDTQFFVVSGAHPNGVGIKLVGRNAVDYGAPIAQNFLQMTENFCSNDQPTRALQGQLWFEKDALTLSVNVSTTPTPQWQRLATVASAGASSGTDGQIRVAGSVVSVWANGAWRQIWPAVYS